MTKYSACPFIYYIAYKTHLQVAYITFISKNGGMQTMNVFTRCQLAVYLSLTHTGTTDFYCSDNVTIKTGFMKE